MCARMSALREYEKKNLCVLEFLFWDNVEKNLDFFVKSARISVLREYKFFFRDFYFLIFWFSVPDLSTTCYCDRNDNNNNDITILIVMMLEVTAIIKN